MMALGQLRRGGLLLVTLVGTAYALWTFYGAGMEATLWGFALLATGIPVWLAMRVSSAAPNPAAEAAPGAPRE
jgi:APA family basic amino acid/polyamine antiporter